jgi:hypothetical protein
MGKSERDDKVKYINNIKYVNSVEESGSPERTVFKAVNAYLATSGDLSMREFEERHPNGFFVEKSHSSVGRNVDFQFSTQQVDRRSVFHELLHNNQQTDALNARAIDIKKKLADTPSSMIKIGRSADNDITLDNNMVSKSHACLYLPLNTKEVYLVDLGSTNCTFLNGEELKPCKMYHLIDYDEIAFGPKTKLVYLFAPTFYRLLVSLAKSDGRKIHF